MRNKTMATFTQRDGHTRRYDPSGGPVGEHADFVRLDSVAPWDNCSLAFEHTERAEPDTVARGVASHVPCVRDRCVAACQGFGRVEVQPHAWKAGA